MTEISDIQNLLQCLAGLIGLILPPIMFVALMGKLLQPKKDHH